MTEFLPSSFWAPSIYNLFLLSPEVTPAADSIRTVPSLLLVRVIPSPSFNFSGLGPMLVSDPEEDTVYIGLQSSNPDEIPIQLDNVLLGWLTKT